MKFKVGDKVKVIKTPEGGKSIEIGNFGIIKKIDGGEWPYRVILDESIKGFGIEEIYNEECLSLLNSEKIRKKLGIK